ncbi:MAG: transposase [Halioglobus sp.]|nr:transposase [Halioglobus sp.]
MDDQAPPSDLAPAPVKQRRRRYPPEFKEQVLRECEQPGASIAGVAVRHTLNPNLVHKWRKARSALTPNSFLQLPAPGAVVEASPTTVRIEVPTPKGTLVVHWPLSALSQSVTWLRALTR